MTVLYFCAAYVIYAAAVNNTTKCLYRVYYNAVLYRVRVSAYFITLNCISI